MDKEQRALLNQYGLNKMLNGMREMAPDKRLPLASVITQLESMIQTLNHFLQARSPAAAAATVSPTI
jgi:hypothetical protein